MAGDPALFAREDNVEGGASRSPAWLCDFGDAGEESL
jgi:hypothetical protein